MGSGKVRFGIPARGRNLLLGLAGLISFAAIWWFYTPFYLDLYVPVPSYEGDIWLRTSRTVSSISYRPGVEYVIRREGTASTDVVGWQSARDGLYYFDRFLRERGWQRTDMYTSGDPVLPETEFLTFGQTFAVYTRPEDTSGFNGGNKGATGRVTVAIWPVSGATEPQAYDATGYNVVMVTARPSLRRALHDAFDD
jgi:hypothetical protein